MLGKRTVHEKKNENTCIYGFANQYIEYQRPIHINS